VRSAPGVLGNDGDVDGDALSAVLVTGPAHGTLALGANGSLTYTPAAGYAGPDSFSYRAQDPAGAQSDPATVTISVTAAAPSSVRVSDLDATRVSGAKGSWTATVTIEVRDDLGALVQGATVTGSFSPAGGTGRSCVTSSNGRCAIISTTIPKRTASVTFSVTAVTAALPYDAAANGDPDGDSNGTSIVIAKP
jgi:hypothetical protein